MAAPVSARKNPSSTVSVSRASVYIIQVKTVLVYFKCSVNQGAHLFYRHKDVDLLHAASPPVNEWFNVRHWIIQYSTSGQLFH